jgi:hypothetical protein
MIASGNHYPHGLRSHELSAGNGVHMTQHITEHGLIIARILDGLV